MRPMATDGAAWSVFVYKCLFVFMLDATVIPAQKAEPIEMSFREEGGKLMWDRETTRGGCKFAPPAEYDWMIRTAAVMRSTTAVQWWANLKSK